MSRAKRRMRVEDEDKDMRRMGGRKVLYILRSRSKGYRSRKEID